MPKELTIPPALDRRATTGKPAPRARKTQRRVLTKTRLFPPKRVIGKTWHNRMQGARLVTAYLPDNSKLGGGNHTFWVAIKQTKAYLVSPFYYSWKDEDTGTMKHHCKRDIMVRKDFERLDCKEYEI